MPRYRSNNYAITYAFFSIFTSELSFLEILVILCFLVRPNGASFCSFLLPTPRIHFVKHVYSTFHPLLRNAILWTNFHWTGRWTSLQRLTSRARILFFELPFFPMFFWKWIFPQWLTPPSLPNPQSLKFMHFVENHATGCFYQDRYSLVECHSDFSPQCTQRLPIKAFGSFRKWGHLDGCYSANAPVQGSTMNPEASTPSVQSLQKRTKQVLDTVLFESIESRCDVCLATSMPEGAVVHTTRSVTSMKVCIC